MSCLVHCFLNVHRHRWCSENWKILLITFRTSDFCLLEILAKAWEADCHFIRSIPDVPVSLFRDCLVCWRWYYACRTVASFGALCGFCAFIHLFLFLCIVLCFLPCCCPLFSFVSRLSTLRVPALTFCSFTFLFAVFRFLLQKGIDHCNRKEPAPPLPSSSSSSTSFSTPISKTTTASVPESSSRACSGLVLALIHDIHPTPGVPLLSRERREEYQSKGIFVFDRFARQIVKRQQLAPCPSWSREEWEREAVSESEKSHVHKATLARLFSSFSVSCPFLLFLSPLHAFPLATSLQLWSPINISSFLQSLSILLSTTRFRIFVLFRLFFHPLCASIMKNFLSHRLRWLATLFQIWNSVAVIKNRGVPWILDCDEESERVFFLLRQQRDSEHGRHYFTRLLGPQLSARVLSAALSLFLFALSERALSPLSQFNVLRHLWQRLCFIFVFVWHAPFCFWFVLHLCARNLLLRSALSLSPFFRLLAVILLLWVLFLRTPSISSLPLSSSMSPSLAFLNLESATRKKEGKSKERTWWERKQSERRFKVRREERRKKKKR